MRKAGEKMGTPKNRLFFGVPPLFLPEIVPDFVGIEKSSASVFIVTHKKQTGIYQ